MATAKKTPKVSTSRKPATKKAAVSRAAVKPAQKTVGAAVRARSAAAKAAGALKTDKPKKPKLVRDSFTIPKTEFTVLQDLKLRAGMHGTAAKKSEILRAGIKALATMNDAAFAAAIGAVPAIKTGRPPRA